MSRTISSLHRILIAIAMLLPAGAGIVQAQTQTKSTDRTMYILPWPAEAEWHPQEPQGGKGVTFIEFLKGKETFDNWTEIGSILKMQLKSPDLSMETTARSMFEESRKTCANATMKVIEKSDTGAHPWIIYTVSCPKYSNGTSESNVYQLIRDENTLYICQRGFRLPELSDARLQEMVAFFKGGRFVQQK